MFSESEQESYSVEQERSRSLKNVTPLISGINTLINETDAKFEATTLYQFEILLFL